MQPRSGAGGREAFSVAEVLVAGCLLMVAMAIAVPVLARGVRLSRVQPDVADLDQRLRMATRTIGRALEAAGAGPASGEEAGALTRRFPAVFPQRRGVVDSDHPTTAFSDRITVVHAVASSPAVRLAMPMVTAASPLVFTPGPPCPADDPACGFAPGLGAVIDSRTGHFDLIRVVSAAAGWLTYAPSPLSRAYTGDDVRIVPAELRQFRFDSPRRQVRVSNGLSPESPWLDDVEAFECRYFGTIHPPPLPRPPLGVATCLFDAEGHPRLPTLGGGAGGLVELPLERLSDGPFCGEGAARYDADLLRIRRILVRVRLAASSGARWQRWSSALDAISSQREVIIDVTPRNLDLRP